MSGKHAAHILARFGLGHAEPIVTTQLATYHMLTGTLLEQLATGTRVAERVRGITGK